LADSTGSLSFNRERKKGKKKAFRLNHQQGKKKKHVPRGLWSYGNLLFHYGGGGEGGGKTGTVREGKSKGINNR